MCMTVVRIMTFSGNIYKIIEYTLLIKWQCHSYTHLNEQFKVFISYIDYFVSVLISNMF